jgi:hypothetical protein
MHKQAFILITLVSCCSTAAALPVLIPRLGTAPHDPAQTYTIVKDYLSDPSKGLFELVRTDSDTHLVIAKRRGIDTRNWSEWAYCKLPPEQLLDTLEDGTVTLTVKISSGGDHLSDVSITADFTGTYVLAGAETSTQCMSKGILENSVLQAAGATPQVN